MTIPYNATDVNGATSSDVNLVITVTGTNDLPVAIADTDAVNEDATITGSVSASDADDGETAGLIYALVEAAPTGLTRRDSSLTRFARCSTRCNSIGKAANNGAIHGSTMTFPATWSAG